MPNFSSQAAQIVKRDAVAFRQGRAEERKLILKIISVEYAEALRMGAGEGIVACKRIAAAIRGREKQEDRKENG